MSVEILLKQTPYGLYYFLIVCGGLVGMYKTRREAEEDARDVGVAA